MIGRDDIKALPTGWKIKTLAQLFNIKSSKRVHEADWKSTGIPFYRAREVVKLAKEGYVDNELFISAELYHEFIKDKGAPKQGDIIISAVGTLGQCYIVKDTDKFYFKDASVLWLEKITNIDSKFIEYLFKSDSMISQIHEGSIGATVGTLTINRAKEIQIPVPTVPEQKRIVAILDQAFAAIDKARANAEQNLKNAKELFESYLNEVFENRLWERRTLNQISENLDSKRVPITKSKRKNGKIPYYGASGIVDYVSDFIFNEDLLCISEDGANLLARTYPIAFSISGKTWVNNHAHVLKFENAVTQKFIEFYINSIRIDDYVSGMAQPKLNQAMLNKISVPYPTIDEQESLVIQIESLQNKKQKIEAIYQKKIDDLDELKKSILQKAFSGELKTTKAVMA